MTGMSLAVAYLLLSVSTMQQAAPGPQSVFAVLGVWILLSSTLMFVYALRAHQARAALYEGLFIAGTLLTVGLVVHAIWNDSASGLDLQARLTLLMLQAGMLALLGR